MHLLLEQQLRKHLDPAAPIPPAWWSFLDDISLVYQQADALRADQYKNSDQATRDLWDQNQQLQTTNAALSAANQWLRSTLECTADGILVVDINSKVISWNGKFLEMWRIPADLVKERDDDKLLKFVLAQLKDPASFIAKIQELYRDQKTISLDVLDFRMAASSSDIPSRIALATNAPDASGAFAISPSAARPLPPSSRRATPPKPPTTPRAASSRT
ncbi:MAG TPA: PAS domain-containing protein [Tepidisphaeraceae bacterium]|jgi:PAS domain-containing protein